MSRETPWVLWPFVTLWRLVAAIVQFTGRLAAIILGIVLMFLGFALTVSVLGAIVGIPLFLLGLMLVFRGLF